MSNITSLGSFSFQNEPSTIRKQSGFVMELVNPEETSIVHLRNLRKPHITMNSFEELIQPTPFRKFSGNITSLEIPSQRDSIISTKKKSATKSEDLLWPKIGSEKHHYKKFGIKTKSISVENLPKSKFSFESKRKQSENNQARNL